MQWIYQNEPVTELPEDCAGIVYLITNTESGRMYIGKKLARFRTTRYRMHTQKNGKKYAKKFAGLSQVTGQTTMGQVMHSQRTLSDWAETDSEGRYFIIAEAKQNAIMWKPENSSHAGCWSPISTTTDTSVCEYTVLLLLTRTYNDEDSLAGHNACLP